MPSPLFLMITTEETMITVLYDNVLVQEIKCDDF